MAIIVKYGIPEPWVVAVHPDVELKSSHGLAYTALFTALWYVISEIFTALYVSRENHHF